MPAVRMGGVPLRFDQLATKEDVDSVIAAALAFCKSAANYHEKYEAAFMAVSYTHLDVYKRQVQIPPTPPRKSSLIR